MLLRLQRYSLKVIYNPGKELDIANDLSQAFLQKHKEYLMEKDLEMNMIKSQLPMSEERLQKFRTATDPEMQLLKDITHIKRIAK